MTRVLETLEHFKGRKGPLLLIIFDGIGIGKNDESNAIHLANTPCMDSLFNSELFTTLQAHGKAVGMPSDADMGNSEVGHNALGSGRVFEQGAALVNNSFDSGDIFKSDTWRQMVDQVNQKNSTFHFLGLLSDGNVHSNISHVIQFMKQCKKENVKKVRIHILLDGRDVYEKSAVKYIDMVEEVLSVINQNPGFDYRIASGGGRMITTMDRYNADWSVVERGWNAHVLGKARMFKSAKEAVETYYAEDEKINDQFLPAFVIESDGKPVGTINDNDSVVNFNFRGDRAIEISIAFEASDFDHFNRERVPSVIYAGMMEYDGDLHVPSKYLVNPPVIENTVSEYLCDNQIKSFAISETQKFGHVTYFWNGNKSGYVNEKFEKYIEIPSDKIQFEKAPQMKAKEITDKTIEILESGEFKFGRLNLANGDMVGHTGNKDAIITAVETVDKCAQRLIDKVNQLDGITVILADHGNADEMYTEKKGEKILSTAHSLNRIPFAIVDKNYNGEYKIADLEHEGLSNVAATILNLLGFKKPDGYDSSLIDVL